jgi:hypothetical protein
MNQVAVLQQGHIVSIEQQAFPEPPKTLFAFALMVSSGFEGTNSFVMAKGITGLFVRCSFGRLKRELDGHYFIASEFRDSVLTYDGGVVYFDKANKVTNSRLVIGPHAKRDDKTVRQCAVKRRGSSAGECPARELVRSTR